MTIRKDIWEAFRRRTASVDYLSSRKFVQQLAPSESFVIHGSGGGAGGGSSSDFSGSAGKVITYTSGDGHIGSDHKEWSVFDETPSHSEFTFGLISEIDKCVERSAEEAVDRTRRLEEEHKADVAAHIGDPHFGMFA